MSQFIEMYRRTHKELTLESVCTIMGKGITPKYVDSSSVVVINQACVHWDGQHLENVKYHNESVPVKKRVLETGDVLLNATGNGTLGRCCVFSCPSDENKYINDGHVIAISTDRSVILPEVLNSYLSLSDTQSEIYRQYVTGSTNQIDIVFTDIKQMTVPVPNMREQQQFVSILQQVDKSKFGDFKSQFIEMFDFNDLSLTSPANDFSKYCKDDTSSATKIVAGDYLSKGIYPIYDQSKDNTIAGYTNKKEGLCDNVPAVLFGDHSRVIKYINTPFFIGADGVKIIRPKINEIIPEFLYYDLKYHTIPNTGYNRHFKFVKMLKLTKASMEKQNEFLLIARQADKSKSVIQKALVYLNDIQSDELGKIA